MPKKILNGIVVSDKPNKTITVMVERKYQHPVLKKVIKARKKYSVHDEENKFKNGDKVESVANRVVIFDSKLQHQAVSCTDEKVRVVINFNYE